MEGPQGWIGTGEWKRNWDGNTRVESQGTSEYVITYFHSQRTTSREACEHLVVHSIGSYEFEIDLSRAMIT